MSYEDTVRTLGTTTRDSTLAVYRQLAGGIITESAAADMMEILILTARTQGEAFGVLSFQAFMEVSTGEAAPVAAAVKAVEPDKRALTRTAIATALGKAPEQRELALALMAFNAPVKSVTNAFNAEMHKDSRVETYTRGLDSNACELCEWLANDGESFPITMEMHMHPGCVCSQIPNVIDGA